MSSRRIAAHKGPDLRRRNAGANEHIVVPPAARKRGRRQPRAEDFQVTFVVPHPLPILDRELRAIEILLGSELQSLLRDDTDNR